MAQRPWPLFSSLEVITLMDPLTHGLAGAVAAQTVSKKEKHRPAALTAFAAALLPDIETFIHHPSDPLFNLEIHRQFTHAIIFIPVGALIAAGLLWWFMRKHLDFREIYLFSLLGYATHGLLDAVTSYGTELLWPISDIRVAWNLIPIIDPVLTLGIGALVAVSFYYRQNIWSLAAVVWVILYLMTGFIQRERAAEYMEKLAVERGHHIERLVVKPSIGNLVLWRSTYLAQDSIYVDAPRPGFFASPVVYFGDSAPAVIPERHYSGFRNTTIYEDILRFYRFSDRFLVMHPEKEQIIGDARYSMVPNHLTPLWGIQVDTTQPGRHVPFMHFRDAGQEVREDFMEMATGAREADYRP